MNLSSVSVTALGSSEDIVFGVREHGSGCRYLVRGIVGIDAEELVPKFYGFGAESGEKFYEYTMPPRDIVMRLILNPSFRTNEDVSAIRDDIYRLISSGRTGQLSLQFNSGSAIVSSIIGKVTKCEVGYFAQTPEMQVTVHCDDPMFRSVAPIGFSPAELPSVNPVPLVDDASTAPHGLSFKVKFTATTSTFVIQDAASSPDWVFQVTPPTNFLTNDELHFSSQYGAKRIFWNKAIGTDIELMDKVISGSVWPQIFPGMNELYFLQIANFDWLELNYYSTFWGL